MASAAPLSVHRSATIGADLERSRLQLRARHVRIVLALLRERTGASARPGRAGARADDQGALSGALEHQPPTAGAPAWPERSASVGRARTAHGELRAPLALAGGGGW